MSDTTDTAPLSEVQIRYNAACLATVALDSALKDAGVEAAMRPPETEGSAVSMILRVHRSVCVEPGPLLGGPGTTEDLVAELTAALDEDGVRCLVEIRDAETGLLILHLKEPEDADALTEWVVAGLSPERSAVRRLRRAFASVGADLHPHAQHGRIEIGSLSPKGVARLYWVLGGTGVTADGMTAVDPGDLEDLAELLSGCFRHEAKLPLLVEAEPACTRCEDSRHGNRLRLGSVTEIQAHLLAAFLESRADTGGGTTDSPERGGAAS